MLQHCDFCNKNVAKKCCKEFEKSTKCCNVNVAQISENDENVAKAKCWNYSISIKRKHKYTLKIKGVLQKIARLVKKSGWIAILISKNLEVFLHISNLNIFCNICDCSKKCCKDFEKLGKCCNVHVARIFMLL